MTRPATLGELRRAGYRVRSVRDEIRENLIARIRRGETSIPGVVGYDRTVIPALQNALLARHDIILLGLRGQAKTRILRSLTWLLDEAVPVVSGCEINDLPFDPHCRRCRRMADEAGDSLPVSWLGRDERYREKLATPDVTVADLIGDIDPIKAANQRLTYSDEEVIHYGIIPRTNRGIFAINELPDLAPRIQVSLLNILEERDLQIRGFPIRIPLDVLLVFSANPEDYTSRGNIITPLKDRIDSQILTHYPAELTDAVAITRQEAWLERPNDEWRVHVPEFVREIVELVAFAARESDLVDQSSGVSARMTISAIEILQSNLERRAALTGDRDVYPRLADLFMMLPAVTGKVEMVYEGEQQGPEMVGRRLVTDGISRWFARSFPQPVRAGQHVAMERERARERRYMEVDLDELPRRGRDLHGPDDQGEGETVTETDYDTITEWFADGNRVTLSDEQPFSEYRLELDRVPALAAVADRYYPVSEAGEQSMVMEIILEALHQALRLTREDLDSTITFAEMAKFNVLRTVK